MTTQSYCLNRHLDSSAAPPMAAALQELRGQALQIDGGEVGFAGALSLQVLVSAHLQWEADGCAFQIAPLSPALATAVSGLGIELAAIGARRDDISEEEDTGTIPDETPEVECAQ